MSSMVLRQVPRVNYWEPEEPNLDEYVFCDKCADFVYEYCSIHGPLLVVPDDKVPTKHNFPSFVPRAALTIPHEFLHLATSVIPGAGIGVFSTLTLPRGVRFGPYKGFKAYEVNSMYCWQIYDSKNKPSHVVDASDGDYSNWMRYVNCARHWREQNLIAFQYQGQLYYRTIKTIPRYTELMVFYGSKFANALRIDLRRYNSPSGYAQKFGAPLVNKRKSEEDNNTEILKKRITKEVEETISPSLKEHQETNTNGAGLQNISSDIKINVGEPVTQLNCTESPTNSKVKTFVCNSYNERFTKNVQTQHRQGTSEIFRTSLDKQNLSNLYEDKLLTQANGTTLLSHINNSNKSDNSKTHIGTHTGQKPFACDVCQYKCNRKDSLKTHMRTHTGEKPFPCDICHYKCNYKISLKRHMRTHTGEKLFACDICHYKCNQKSDLKMHMRTHTGEKPFACDICHYKCNQKGSLKAHMRTHTGEKPFACDICHYKCNQKGRLKAHMRTHTGEKPFACDICHYKCNQKGDLKMHMRTHTGEKPFACDICHYKCNYKNSLKAHMRTHTGEKPFPCDICHYKCNYKISLKRHMTTHTGEKPFACDICHYKCNQRGSLNKHLKIHKKS